MRHTFSGSGANRVDRVVDAVLPITQSWHSLDPHLPLGPVGGSEEDIMLTRQAAHAAKAILDLAPPKIARETPKLETLRGGVALDYADASLRLGDRSRDVRDVLLDMPGLYSVEDINKYGERIDRAFMWLSANAMDLHIRAVELAANKNLDEIRRRGAQAVLRAELGSLIKTGVDILDEFHKRYESGKSEGRHGTDISGALVEGMYLMYEFVRWYKKADSGAMAHWYPRHALPREDKANWPGNPRKNFDIILVQPRPGGQHQLSQVKTARWQHGQSGESGYHSLVRVARPGVRDLIGSSEHIMELFKEVVSDKTDPQRQVAAMNELAHYLGEQPTRRHDKRSSRRAHF